MRANEDLYRYHILTEAVAARGITWPTNEEQQSYIVEEHLQLLRRNGEWGGSEVLNAVRDMLGCTIRVFSKYTEPLEFEGRTSETVNIFYNGINHYDSVTKVIEINDEAAAIGKGDQRRRDEMISDPQTKSTTLPNTKQQSHQIIGKAAGYNEEAPSNQQEGIFESKGPNNTPSVSVPQKHLGKPITQHQYNPQYVNQKFYYRGIYLS